MIITWNIFHGQSKINAGEKTEKTKNHQIRTK